ncbi:hypothetical protein A3K48_07930 [candidate division WOR-1 bacterium RIFOXYA12_FULL_52_29]|uniref:DUF3857 domain-containing protein n=1 Tax=candidate division WOR-1 bacterium RIFOXYC12_FULL_54_18 TaxID=1802584 RepID=A0A1F4T863_UNCSA|nr:MAG: hypothetical protein A3K44_07930 [candidate division WOR-1 bacterium RIFOXYA2_FULL_51_19]OGC18439.1 MAG: hypothetical protein A3K48_07930 [candidate division WOR-1 bacterium RIFOXYA12_FULL_52_29]OGC27293.1 MAG: hypothetical protein A3K32_07925 [candidate division WOR-1 bacterium RIFOXYB2_FULL_45_9]OGC28856.1 MAG: hypothetical protein A3K49_07930 [candidate division WOR-1 bacterium RIFOXYC12_FULL_54_18]OGC30635.1 MAG: hypothetical protein A2346_00045 [candidate division WOR-1 bacterium R
MKKLLSFVLLLFLAGSLAAAEPQSVKLINSTNWNKWIDQTIGYLYESHGCLHFTPTDIYLLAQTVPAGIPLTVKKYKLKETEPDFDPDQVPYLAELTASPQDIKKHALTFKTDVTSIVVYPSLGWLVIMVKGVPYAKLQTLAGPPEDILMQGDFMLTTPTDSGEYKILRTTDHYVSANYYQNTIVPFGAWLKRSGALWLYQKKNAWHKAPANVAADLERPPSQWVYNYYDLNYDSRGKLTAARYAGHDFGKYVLLWTTDGKNHYPEMGYAAGQLVYEQIVLVKELVNLLTLPGPDDLSSVLARDKELQFYKSLRDFKTSGGTKVPADVEPALLREYKLFNGFDLTAEERRALDPRLVKALKEYREKRLPRDKRARREALGLYYYLRNNSLVIDKHAGWYERIKGDWEFFSRLRAALRQDFESFGVLSLANRQNIVEQWLNERLEFKTVAPPSQAKGVAELSFSAFFKPKEEATLFDEREREIMVEKIRKATKGDETGLNLNIVDALNNYNFGVLLNQILGDLYKSHGCLHLSPRNMVFIYDLLPVGSQMKVYKYSESVSREALAAVPYLADLINFQDDFDQLKKRFTVTAEVQVAVYPNSGDWIVYLQKKPFARATVKGGPQTKYYLLQGRDPKGNPIFEPNLAYPTTPGDYVILRKVENYLSNLYRDQTVIPMGGAILKQGKWVFQDREGRWKELPRSIADDLNQPSDRQVYNYFDRAENASGETISVRWGSHPFGRFALQSSLNGRTPWPELIHSSGDLIVEERQLVSDLIGLLTAPRDRLEDCLNPNFELYRACFEFTRNPDRTDLIQPKERAAYRLYFNLPLTDKEKALLPPDAIVASKVARGETINAAEKELLIKEGVAYRRSGNFKVNQEKIIGLRLDLYQYVVAIGKGANHYGVLKEHWAELSGLRQALLKDFNNFVLKDPRLFHDFMRELMLKRNRLERLTQKNAVEILDRMLSDPH